MPVGAAAADSTLQMPLQKFNGRSVLRLLLLLLLLLVQSGMEAFVVRNGESLLFIKFRRGVTFNWFLLARSNFHFK